MQEVTLFFGGSVPGPAWARFTAEVLTPAFPDGLTITEAAGQWRDPRTGQVEKEGARVMRAFGHPARGAVETVRAAYRARFDQQSVGLSIGQACAAF